MATRIPRTIKILFSSLIVAYFSTAHASGSETTFSSQSATSKQSLHVDRLYTYGAPSVVKGSGITNGNEECIPGLRIYNEDINVVECSWYEQLWCTAGKQVTNVDFASQINVKNGYHHPKVATLVVRLIDGANVDFSYQPCHSYESSIEQYQWWPDANLPSDMLNSNHHMAEHYMPRLALVPYSIQGQSLQYTSVSVCIQKSSLDEIEYCFDHFEQETPVGNEGVARTGWKLFAYMKCQTEGLLSDSDTVIVLNNDDESTNYRSCLISFQGSDSVMDLMKFVSINNEGTSYCGRLGVHSGTANELWTITHDSQYATEIVPALETCHEVTCVGHSLGGALCNLFTMCANQRLVTLQGNGYEEVVNDAKNWDDYNSLIWTKKSYVTNDSSW